MQVFPDHELAMVVIGTIKGNGSGVIKPVTRLNLRGSSKIAMLHTIYNTCKKVIFLKYSIFLIGFSVGCGSLQVVRWEFL